MALVVASPQIGNHPLSVVPLWKVIVGRPAPTSTKPGPQGPGFLFGADSCFNKPTCDAADAALNTNADAPSVSNTPSLNSNFGSVSADAGTRTLEPRVEDVAEAVAEQVDAKHGEEDAEAGKQRQPPRRADVGPPVGQHAAPSRNL